MDQQPARRIKLALALSGSLLLQLVSPAALLASPFPADHSASYIIQKYDSPVGEMHTRLKHQQGQLDYTSTTRAIGFAALFVGKDLEERSLSIALSSPEGEFRQRSYRAERGKKHKQNQHFTFDWQSPRQASIQGYYKGDYQLQVQQPTWGRHMLPLLMSRDLLAAGQTSRGELQITDKGRIHQYQYTREGSETLSLAGESIPTIRFRLSRKGSDRVSHVWLSKQHQYLPVKIEQYKDDELHMSMQLDHYSTK